MVVTSSASQDTPMHLFWRPRTRMGMTGLAILALFVHAPGASISFAAEQTSNAPQAAIQRDASGDFDPTVIYHETTHGIIMRDGGVCNPILHIGC